MDPTEARRPAVLFCLAYLLSAFGYEFILFVMTVRIYDLTGSAWNVGVFTALTFSTKLLAPYFGLLTDRYPKKTLFAATAGAAAALANAIALTEDVALVYALWILLSSVMMLIMNVRTALMTEVMPRDGYLRGNSLVLLLLNAARIVSPLAGGLIAGFWSTKALVHLTSVLYVAALAACAFIDLPEAETAPKTPVGVFASMREGAAHLFESRDLAYLAALAVSWRACLGLQASLFVVYVKRCLGLGDAAYGLFLTVVGLGSIAGSLAGPVAAKRYTASKAVPWGLVAHYLLFASLGWIRAYPLALAVAFASYFAFLTTVVAVHSLRDTRTPVALRGRVYGCLSGLTTPAAMISTLAGGYLAGRYGVQSVLAGAGVLAVVCLAAIQRLYGGSRVRVGEVLP